MWIMITIQIIAFVVFIHSYERHTAGFFQARQMHYASILYRSVWDLDFDHLSTLIDTIVVNREFYSFEVVIPDVDLRFSETFDDMNPFDRWLSSLGLIRNVELVGEIHYNDTQIASILSSWSNKNVYVYFPVLLTVFLFDLFVFFFFTVLKNRKTLKKEVEMRTSAQNQLVLLNNELETQVKNRTIQLETANQQLTREIQERCEIADQLQIAKLKTDSLNRELMTQNEELEAMNQELEEAYRLQADLSEKLEKMISMSDDLTDIADDSMDDLFSRILEMAMSLVPESDCGSISIIEGDQWRFIDAIGHNIRELKKLHLKKDYLIIQQDRSRRVEKILSKNAPFPKEVNEQLVKASMPIKDTLISYLEIDGNVVGSLAIDISENNPSNFAEDSIRVIRSLANMASAFLAMQRIIQAERELRKTKDALEMANQKLLDQNESLEMMVGEVQRLAEGLEEIIRVSNRISEAVLGKPDDFLRDILELLVGLVEHSDYGSVSIFEGEYRRFVHLIGHDVDLLGGYRMKISEMDRINTLEMVGMTQPSIVEGIVEESMPFMDQETKRRVEQGSLPIKSSIVTYLGIKDKTFGQITLDIAEGSPHLFTKNDMRIVQAFSNIASAFLGLQRFMIQQEQIQKDLLLSMIQILEIYDMYTKGHSENVAFYSTQLAKRLQAPPEWVNQVYWAGLVHDIGKLLIPTQILNKPSKLSEEEYELVKMHPVWGEKVLRTSEHLKDVSTFVLHHHERWDGKGYPDGLAGEEIPLASRIICVADAFDAMISERSYRKPFSFDRARQELLRNSGTQFDPQIVKLFMDLEEKELVPQTNQKTDLG